MTSASYWTFLDSDAAGCSAALTGKTVAKVVFSGFRAAAIHFTDGAVLDLVANGPEVDDLELTITQPAAGRPPAPPLKESM